MENTIYQYTRKQAIEDGLLVDVSNTPEALGSGFKIPVCLTLGVHSLCEVPRGLEGIEDFKGRLWDTLYLASLAFRAWKKNPKDNDGRIIPYSVLYRWGIKENQKKTYRLWLVFNEYEEGFTIMKPEEY